MKSSRLNSILKNILLGSLISIPTNILAENHSANEIEIILDASGSMAEVVSGKSKMDSAKEAIKKLVEKVPADTRVGLRAYGHQSPVSEKNCKDSQLLVPINSIDKNDFNSQVGAIVPNGYTPIEYSLLEAKKDFEKNSELKKMIILVSDGKETCEGDPCKAVKILKDSGFDLEVNVVGFSVDSDTEKELSCIAEATGGVYKNASNAEDLANTLEAYTKRAKIEYSSTAEKIKPGSGFGDATEIEAGELGMDILDGEKHFYKVDVKKGQTLSVVTNISNRAPNSTMACHHRVRVNLFNSRKTKIKTNDSTIEGNSVGLTSIPIEDYKIRKTETIYIMVTDAAYKGMGSKGCDKLTILYELGLYLEGVGETSNPEKETTSEE